MTKLEHRLHRFERVPLFLQQLLFVLKDYRRPHDKINEMVKSGQLIMVKKGMYLPGPELELSGPHPFLIANHLNGPSYVSLESALAYWGMIPERSVETSSITMKRSKTYDTPIGRFSFTHAPLPYYSYGIVREKINDRETVLIASREKAICDKIITTSGINLRSVSQTREYLFEDLRLNEDIISRLDVSEIRSWAKHSPKRTSINMLTKTLAS